MAAKARRIPKRKWVRIDGVSYLISVYSRRIWAKITGWHEGLPEDAIQKITVTCYANNGNLVEAICGGFGLDEAKTVIAEPLALHPFPEKLTLNAKKQSA